MGEVEEKRYNNWALRCADISRPTGDELAKETEKGSMKDREMLKSK